jgi:hypothetical protein
MTDILEKCQHVHSVGADSWRRLSVTADTIKYDVRFLINPKLPFSVRYSFPRIGRAVPGGFSGAGRSNYKLTESISLLAERIGLAFKVSESLSGNLILRIRCFATIGELLLHHGGLLSHHAPLSTRDVKSGESSDSQRGSQTYDPSFTTLKTIFEYLDFAVLLIVGYGLAVAAWWLLIFRHGVRAVVSALALLAVAFIAVAYAIDLSAGWGV